MRKSAYASTGRKPDSYRRTRALKRDCTYTRVEEGHLKYLWGAYKMGAFKDSSIPIQDGFSPAEFKGFITDTVLTLIQAGGEMVAAVYNDRPIGLIAVLKGQGNILFPHAVWFQWASARNRMVCALRVLLDLRDTGLVLITVNDKEAPLFAHLCKYGALRKVGVIRQYAQPGADMLLFQGVKA